MRHLDQLWTSLASLSSLRDNVNNNSLDSSSKSFLKSDPEKNQLLMANPKKLSFSNFFNKTHFRQKPEKTRDLKMVEAQFGESLVW